MMASIMRDKSTRIKVVVLGDSGVGKTCLLLRLGSRPFSKDSPPQLAEILTPAFNYDDALFRLELQDTHAQEEHDESRWLSLVGANVLVLCFSADSPSSFDHVRTKWLVEANEHCPGVPVVIVCTKLDNRFDKDACDAVTSQYGRGCIATDEGMDLAQSLGVAKYLECSALTSQGTHPMCFQLVQTYLASPSGDSAASKKKKGNCAVM